MNDTNKIFVPAHVELKEPEDFCGMKVIRYSGEWNPYPYKPPLLIRISLWMSIAAVILNIVSLYLRFG